MEHEEGFARFFVYMNLFMAMMLTLVLGLQPARHVRRMGGGRALLVPPDRLLLRPAVRCAHGLDVRGRGPQGVPGQPHRRLRVRDRHALPDHDLRHARLPRHRRRRSPAEANAHHALLAIGRDPAFHRRLRQVGADSAVRLAPRRDGRPDPGVGADPRGDDGHRGRLHGHAHVRAVRRTLPRRWA